MARSRVQTIRSNVSGARPSGQEPGTLFTNWPDRQIGVVDAGRQPVDLVAVRYFSATASYTPGQLVVQNGKVYRAIAVISPSAFDPTKWQEITVQSGSGIWVGDSPRAEAPVQGQLLWESDSGDLFVWYEDADGGQWVQINTTGDTSPGFWATRGALANDIVSGAITVSDGAIYAAAGYLYLGKPSTTAIPDLPGLTPLGSVTPQHFGAKADGVTNDAAAFNAAIDYAASLGGGQVYARAGTYLLADAALSLTQHTAIMLRDKVQLVGDGPGATVLRLANGANCHVVFGRDLIDGGVSNLSIDGNRASQALNDGGAGSAPAGILFAGNLDRAYVGRVHVRNAYDYGIGVEVGRATDCIFENILIEDAGADGMDFKNTTSNSTGNVVRGFTARRWGLQGETGEAFAGLDLSGQVMVDTVRVEQLGFGKGTTGRTGIRLHLRDGANPLAGTTLSRLSNFWIGGDGTTYRGDVSVIGVDCFAEGCRVEGGHIERVGIGLSRDQRRTLVSNLTIRDCRRGWVEDSTRTSGGNPLPSFPIDGSATNIVITDCNAAAGYIGMRLEASVSGQSYYGVTLINNDINLSIAPGSINNRWIGGSIKSPVATNVTGTIAGNRFVEVDGFNNVSGTYETADFALDAVGVTSHVIAHGLSITPEFKNCVVAITVNGSTVDDFVAFAFVRAITATNVTLKAKVTVASATAGLTGRVSLHILI